MKDLISPESEVIQIRGWNSIESNVIPLIFKREPQSYMRQSTMFIVSKNHSEYNTLKKSIENWYIDCPKGHTIDIDCTSKFDDTDFQSKCWYVIDLRKDKDTFKNLINLTNFEKLPNFAQCRLSFNIYEKVKGLVIFADSIDDIPDTLKTQAVIGLTSGNTLSLFNLLRDGCSDSPNRNIPIKRDSTLAGFHRFEAAPTFVQF